MNKYAWLDDIHMQRRDGMKNLKVGAGWKLGDKPSPVITAILDTEEKLDLSLFVDHGCLCVTNHNFAYPPIGKATVTQNMVKDTLENRIKLETKVVIDINVEDERMRNNSIIGPINVGYAYVEEKDKPRKLLYVSINYIGTDYEVKF